MKTTIKLLLLAPVAFLAMASLAQTTPAPAPAEARPVTPPGVSDLAQAAPTAPMAKPAVDVPAPAPKPAVDAPAPKPALETPAAKPVGDPAPKPEAVVVTKQALDTNRVSAAGEVVPFIVIDDVPLLDAVKTLARQAGLNFQFDPRVTMTTSNQPNVTVRFENVTAEDALTAVLDNYGLALQHDPKRHISKITIKDPKAEDPLVCRVIQLKNSSPSNLVTLLKATLSARSQVLPDARTSQIVVMATEREMVGVEELVLKLDAETKQVLIEAQLWETSKSPSSVKGIDWSGTLAAQHVTFGNGNTSGNIINSGTQSRNSANSFNNSINSTVTSPGTTGDTPGGRPITADSSTASIDTRNGASSGGSSGVSSIASLLTTAVGGSGIGLNTARGFSPATAFLNADGLSAVISFLNTDTDTELVSTPRAVTLDNELATLNVSRAYPVYNITPGSANSPAGSQVTWTNVGMILSVTPRISANSNINLRVVPELSDIAGQDSQQINGVKYTANIYGIRRVETHVVIRSGTTLVMGGLMNDRFYKAYTKVPVLGDAPILGLLFRKDTKQRDKSNLMIFVTPTIIGETDFMPAKPSGFLKSECKPENSEKPTSWWDGGAPYDWTKKNTNNAPLPKTADAKTGKL
jgi:type II secretory pathway component GspD/PulD (secretin)